jgi:hypothetical protein
MKTNLSFVIVSCLLVGLRLDSQVRILTDYLVKLNRDTVYGKVRKTNFYTANKIILDSNGKTINFSVNTLKEIYFEGERYVRLEYKPRFHKTEVNYAGKFVKPHVEHGVLKVYQTKKIKFLVRDNNVLGIKLLKYYADDFPETRRFLKSKDKEDSLISFALRYNAFKEKNPGLLSFAEKNLHFKKLFNPQIAVNFTGLFPAYNYIGAEIGLSERMTISPRISCLFVSNSAFRNLEIAPYSELIGKFYFLNNRRLKKELMTYYYSGWYGSVCYMHPLKEAYTRNLRFEIGEKTVTFSNLYIDTSIGAYHSIENNSFGLWAFVGLGYVL